MMQMKINSEEWEKEGNRKVTESVKMKNATDLDNTIAVRVRMEGI